MYFKVKFNRNITKQPNILPQNNLNNEKIINNNNELIKNYNSANQTYSSSKKSENRNMLRKNSNLEKPSISSCEKNSRSEYDRHFQKINKEIFDKNLNEKIIAKTYEDHSIDNNDLRKKLYYFRSTHMSNPIDYTFLRYIVRRLIIFSKPC